METATQPVAPADEQESNIRLIKATSGGVEAEAEWDSGSSLDEAVERFGKEVVWEYFLRQGDRNCSNRIRSILQNEGDQDTVTEAFEKEPFIPGVSRRAVGKSGTAKIKNVIANLDEAGVATLLEQLKGRMAELKQNGAPESEEGED
jgi:hypothetical protein